MCAWLPAFMRSLSSCQHFRLASTAKQSSADVLGRGISRLLPGSCALQTPSQRCLSQAAVPQRALEVETLENEEGRLHLRGDTQLRATPAKLQEEEEESWQDVAADCPKEVEAAKRRKALPPKLYEDDEHCIRGVQIPRSAWLVLLKLRAAGHEGYIVGGAVRDLLLKGQPKDMDILTTATVHQVKSLLNRSRLIGRRFPIVQVMVDGDMVEVSSFSTGVALTDLPFDAAALLGRKNVQLGDVNSHQGAGRLWRDARRQNAMARDFTVNALMYDPFSRVIFDYTGGVQDCRKTILRSIIKPETSFAQDPARIIRAIRLAARAGLKVDDPTGRAIRSEMKLLCSLPPGRVHMEVHALMAYGSAAKSMQLLWQYELLDFFFPLLAEYLTERKYPRSPRKPKSDLLFDVLARMDQKASPDYPLAPAAWSAVLVGFLASRAAAETDGALEPPSQPPGRRTESNTKSTVSQPVSPPPPVAAPANQLENEDGWLDDMEILGLQATPPAASASDSEDESDIEDDPHMKVTARVLDSVIDDTPVRCIAKAQRFQVLSLLRGDYSRRCTALQFITLKCGLCKQLSRVEMSIQRPKCDKCGHQLPTKRLKMAKRPELMALAHALQPCYESRETLS